MAVDRRNGRIVYDDPDRRGPMRPGWGWKFTVIRSRRACGSPPIPRSVNLTFTDKPIKTTVRHSTGVKKPARQVGRSPAVKVEGAAGMAR